jgi:beta-glucosidase
MERRSGRTFYSASVAGLLFAVGGVALAAAPAKPASAGRSPDAKVEARVEALLQQLTLEEKVDMLGGVEGFYVRGIPRLGLPPLKMSDGPLGARNDGPATTMAGGIALTASWDPALAKDVGAQIARDARARGVHFMLGPAVNIHVAPMNGRNF